MLVAISELLNWIIANPIAAFFAFLSLILSSIIWFMRNALFYEYKRWREQRQEDDGYTEWYNEALTLSRQVQRFWESKYVEPQSRGEAVNYDEVKGEMGLLADQLDRLATRADEEIVPPEFLNLVYRTANHCRRIERVRIGVGRNSEFEERGEEAVENADQLEEAAKRRL